MARIDRGHRKIRDQDMASALRIACALCAPFSFHRLPLLFSCEKYQRSVEWRHDISENRKKARSAWHRKMAASSWRNIGAAASARTQRAASRVRKRLRASRALRLMRIRALAHLGAEITTAWHRGKNQRQRW